MNTISKQFGDLKVVKDELGITIFGGDEVGDAFGKLLCFFNVKGMESLAEYITTSDLTYPKQFVDLVVTKNELGIDIFGVDRKAICFFNIQGAFSLAEFITDK